MELEVQRLDTMTVAAGGVITPDGYLETTGALAKTGVLEYPRADGSVQRELVLPESDTVTPDEVLPLTFDGLGVGHPKRTASNPDGVVTPENYKDVSVGFVFSPRLDETGHMRARIRIMDRAAIAAVQSGVVQLSAGYRARLQPVPGGVHRDAQGNEHRVDYLQVGRRLNHVALVSKGRAGPTVRLDSAGNQRFDGGMDLVELQKALAESQALVTKLQAEVATATVAVTKADAERAAVAADLEATKVRADAAEKTVAEIERGKLVERVAKVTRLDATSFVGKSELEILKAAVTALAPTVRQDSWDLPNARVAFDVVVQSAEQRRPNGATAAAQAVTSARRTPEVAKADASANPKSTMAVMEAAKAALRNQWKNDPKGAK